MNNSIGIIILAAGKGTRMKIDTPKALVPALGQPLLDYVINASMEFASKCSLDAEIGVVIGHRKELMEAWWETHKHKSYLKLAWQREQNGTADALRSCFKDYPGFWKNEYTVVSCADTPMISSQEFIKLLEELRNNSALIGVAATFETEEPGGYGRIVKSGNGFRIVEENDASKEEKKITEVNSGFYILKTSHVKSVLGSITNKNKSGEFYLTDMFQSDFMVKPVKFTTKTPFLGINTLEQLAQVKEVLLERKFKTLYGEGVTLLSPKTVYLDNEVKIGSGTVIYPGVTLLGNTEIGQQVVLESGTFIKNSKVGNSTVILANSYLEEAIVFENASIGPMARLRPGTEVGEYAKIGNFVEVKKSKLGSGVKISHLSYVGDAEIGENTNIGCGFITCNYDGLKKHKTKIGKNTFIGSSCQMIAPIQIGNEVFIAAGSTITKDVPDGSFGIARSQQTTKEGMAGRFLKTKKN
jgi:bifunctional UDP-N-acetylglucosamine pyrophosphorylase / glucosamine-1-phosphate N-acetyltransferase